MTFIIVSFSGSEPLSCSCLLFLTKLQGLEINPVGERGAAHLIAALHTNAVVGGMLQALHAVGKGWHWGDFSGDLLAIW